MTGFTESIVEEAALAVLGRLGWAVLHGPEIAVGTAAAERADPGYRSPALPDDASQPAPMGRACQLEFR